MTINSEAQELATDIFRLRMQNEQEPDFSACLAQAIELQAEETPPAKETCAQNETNSLTS